MARRRNEERLFDTYYDLLTGFAEKCLNRNAFPEKVIYGVNDALRFGFEEGDTPTMRLYDSFMNHVIGTLDHRNEYPDTDNFQLVGRIVSQWAERMYNDSTYQEGWELDHGEWKLFDNNSYSSRRGSRHGRDRDYDDRPEEIDPRTMAFSGGRESGRGSGQMGRLSRRRRSSQEESRSVYSSAPRRDERSSLEDSASRAMMDAANFSIEPIDTPRFRQPQTQPKPSYERRTQPEPESRAAFIREPNRERRNTDVRKSASDEQREMLDRIRNNIRANVNADAIMGDREDALATNVPTPLSSISTSDREGARRTILNGVREQEARERQQQARVQEQPQPQPKPQVDDSKNGFNEQFKFVDQYAEGDFPSEEKSSNYGFRVVERLKGYGSEGTKFNIQDMEFKLPCGSAREVNDYAKIVYEGFTSFMARIKYTRLVPLNINKDIFDRAIPIVTAALPDFDNVTTPGLLLTTVLGDYFTRNEQKCIETILVNELNDRIKINYFNFNLPEVSCAIEELSDFDEIVDSSEAKELLKDNASNWKTACLMTFQSVLRKFFISPKYISSPSDANVKDLIHCKTDFMAHGMNMGAALTSNSEATRNRYLEAFFESRVVLYDESLCFYTDILEDEPDIRSYMTQYEPASKAENAVFAAISAELQPRTGKHCLTIRDSMEQDVIPLYSRRPGHISGMRVTFPFLPVPSKLIYRNDYWDYLYTRDETQAENPIADIIREKLDRVAVRKTSASLASAFPVETEVEVEEITEEVSPLYSEDFLTAHETRVELPDDESLSRAMNLPKSTGPNDPKDNLI